MIEVKNLTKQYGSHLAVNHINFTVNDGEILGFLGPNGAGKTTTMNMITGYLSSTYGDVFIDGINVLDNPSAAKTRIGYLPEQPPLYLDMTVREYLSFVFNLKKVRMPRAPHINEICRLVKIDHVAGRLIKNLSKGYRQRVGIAQALIGNPDVLILDEPTVGLDPKQIIEIRNLIAHLGRTHTIILSSHILSEIQATCERIIVINRGNIVADDTPDNLSKKLSSDLSLTARINGPKGDVMKLIKSIKGVENVTFKGSREAGTFEFYIEPATGVDIRKTLFSRLADRNWPLMLLESNELSLEEVFIRLTDIGDDEEGVTASAPAASVPLTDASDDEDEDIPAESTERVLKKSAVSIVDSILDIGEEEDADEDETAAGDKEEE